MTVVGTRFLCRIGLHRWSFSSYLLDDPGHLVHTECVRARCTRQGCTRYGAWSVVHTRTRLDWHVALRDQ